MCPGKKKLETCIAELYTQRNTYSARAQELKESFLKEQADVDRLEGRSLSAFFYNVIGKMDEKLTQERQEAYAAQVKYDAVARELAGIEEDLERYQAELYSLQNCEPAISLCCARKPRPSRPTAATLHNKSCVWKSALPIWRVRAVNWKKPLQPARVRWPHRPDPGQSGQCRKLGHLGPGGRRPGGRPGKAQPFG